MILLEKIGTRRFILEGLSDNKTYVIVMCKQMLQIRKYVSFRTLWFWFSIRKQFYSLFERSRYVTIHRKFHTTSLITRCKVT